MNRVRVAFRKWDGTRHWEYDALVLGADRHGTWLGARAGADVARPGMAFVTDHALVVLVPDGEGFVASFYEDVPVASFALYVDIATPPVRDGATVTAVDLDLDVIRDRDGRVRVDDEDEFAEHRASMRYPDDVAERALRTCAEVLAAVREARPPYDGATAAGWLDVLARSRASSTNSETSWKAPSS